MQKMNITIFGAGAWGTAMAIHSARLGNKTTLVPRREEHAQELLAAQENKDYLPGYALPESLQITTSIKKALMETEIALLACPSKGLRDLCEKIQANLEPEHSVKAFLTLCKGLEQSTLMAPVTVAKEVLGDAQCGVLSGPSFANEVAAGKPTAIVLATEKDDETLKQGQKALSSPELRVYRSTDLSGVEYGGCLKNVYAIGAGICDGLQLGDNAKAAYLTRAMSELVRLGTELGGQTSTFYGLSGFGDMVATCSGLGSRNRTFGQQIAEGNSVENLLKERKTVVEGHWATQCFHDLLDKKGIEAPILSEIYKVLYKEKLPSEALISLMTRELKAEG